MHSYVSRQWRALSSGTPGRRFRDRYERNKRNKNRPWFGRVLRLLLAAVAFATGVLLTVIPGPATPLFLLAGALVATDWLWMAKVMDRVEVWLRKILKPVVKLWHRLPVYGRVALMLATSTASVITSYTVYRLMH